MRSPLLILLLPLVSAHLLPRQNYNGHSYNDTPSIEDSTDGQADGSTVEMPATLPVSSSIATPSLVTTDPLVPGRIFGVYEDSEDCEDEIGDPSTGPVTYYAPPESEEDPTPELPANTFSRNWSSDAEETDNTQSSTAPQITSWSAKTSDSLPVSTKVVSRSVPSSSQEDEAETPAPAEEFPQAEPEVEEGPEDYEQNGSDAQEQDGSPEEQEKEESLEAPSPTYKEPETVEQTVFIAYTSEAEGKKEPTTKVVTMSTAVSNKDEHPIEDLTISLNELPTPTVSPTLANKNADDSDATEGQATWITTAVIAHTANNGAVSTEYLPTTIYIPQSDWDTRLWTTSTAESAASPTTSSKGGNPSSSASPTQKKTTARNTVLESLSKDPQVTIVQTLAPSTSADSSGSASTVVQQVILFSAGQSVTTAVSTSTVGPSPSPTAEEEFSLADDPNAGSSLRARSRSAPGQTGVMAYLPSDPLFWGAMLAATAGVMWVGGDGMVLVEIVGLMLGIVGFVVVVASHPEVVERLAGEGAEMGGRCVATLENIWHT